MRFNLLKRSSEDSSGVRGAPTRPGEGKKEKFGQFRRREPIGPKLKIFFKSSSGATFDKKNLKFFFSKKKVYLVKMHNFGQK